ncbi:hypothetical protein [Enterocloster sp.]|jgi:hypothetical protein|uniref:hypothetical protein n=1 Tax=Enterocloster sp. TaxID=2719315 RepID=UPI00205F19EF|nr:MAG TPA: hypothetical protein [Caudoviricetes sp.]
MYYKGIGPEAGTIVEEDQAYQYALERCANATPEEKQEFVDWYYSGNWAEMEDWEK